MGLTRLSFEEQHGIKKTTIEKWEMGTSTISPRKLDELVSAARKHNVVCQRDWILFGRGEPPEVVSGRERNLSEEANINYTVRLANDFIHFNKTYPNGDTLLITDNSMLEKFSPGDYVFGVKIDISDAPKYVGKPAIVETEDGKKRLRNLGYTDGDYFLYSNNMKNTQSQIIEKGIDILSIAPIIWHRFHFVSL